MLLNNAGFIPHMIDGLQVMLDPEHPHKDTDEAIKTAVQRDFAESLSASIRSLCSLPDVKLSMWIPQPSSIPWLDVLVDKAWSEEAKDCARGGALMQLTYGSPSRGRDRPGSAPHHES